MQYFALTSLALPESQCHSNDKGWDCLHWGDAEGACHTLGEKANRATTTLPNTQRQPESPGSGFCLWDKTRLGVVPVCIKPADKGDGLVPWWPKLSGRGRAGAGADALWYHLPASIICASSSLCQAARNPLETWRGLCAIWEMTQRHLAFAEMPCALWKFIGFSCDSQDRSTQRGFLLKLGLKEGQTNLTFLAVK